ncbi:phosphatidate cytidylyltransferase [Chitinophaga nivalis]|uniref:Phosphatidate cytidylyltransferase n=1 Tax=Chitinophaga nivalis TaxID=2991709 RepID=A0ABT3IV29_9BACT|nr:phosphatidate cytidylyltransferase [Chitinophaga nivalis]MCW3462489.1 phosphatidate cytidylyltransferase [Chitinophaga nivalis]MCW3487820.1 phosphatidate cytidylyltransferase [Chitinophaga nivalis]
MKTFFTRTASALVFVAVMLGGILWSPFTFFLLFFLIGCFALQEYFKLLRLIDTDYAAVSGWHKWGVLVAGAAIMLTFTGDTFSIGHMAAGLIGWWIAVIFLLVLPLGEILLGKDFSLKNLGYSAMGLLYVIIPFSLLIHIRMNAIDLQYTPGNVGTAPGWLIPLLLIIFIWINDTMAYIVGSLIGRTPFFPAISPKKTMEGSVGGMILAVVAAGVYGYYWGQEYLALQHWLVLAGLAAIFGTIGDLLESKLKRMAGVKDSGAIMPGHGGFLDRFDSLLLAAPFAWIYVHFFMMA